jgi:2-methylaconitate cis-trans-isomerase PrpF
MAKSMTLPRPSERNGSQGFLDIPTISCALINCGTSRAVIVHGDDLPTEQGSAERFLFKLMTGNGTSGGLGGNHYQLNKVAVVYPAREPEQFAFRFYQVDRAKDRMVSNMECANVAAGAGLFAVINGIATPHQDGSLRAINKGTGQQIDLQPVSTMPLWSNDWRVRFRQETLSTQTQAISEPRVMAHPDGRSVDYWVMERGNVFVLANAEPEAAEPELIEQLTASGTEISLSLGSSRQLAAMPKVLLYSVQTRELTQAVIHAACFFNGEIHNSLPGSGAMCLASFLALSHLLDTQPQALSGTLTFYLMHPSGMLTVRVNWESFAQGYRIVSTEFVTSVRLLMRGEAIADVDERAQP